MSPRASLSIRAASVHVCSRPPGEPPRAATAGACRRPRAVSMPLRLRRRRRGASGPRVAESHARGGAEHRAVGPAGPGSRSRRPADCGRSPSQGWDPQCPGEGAGLGGFACGRRVAAGGRSLRGAALPRLHPHLLLHLRTGRDGRGRGRPPHAPGRYGFQCLLSKPYFPQ